MAFFLALNMHKIHLQLVTGGAYDAAPVHSQMVRGYPSTRFLPIDAFGVSISAHTE